MQHLCDAVVIGAGLAGSALATKLAQAGVEVLLLERDWTRIDRVRGEFMQPWGDSELKKLELYDVLREAGAHHTTRHIPYGDDVEPVEAEQRARDLGTVLPDVPGPLCMRHPDACMALAQAAEAAGAKLLCGVRSIRVEPGERPTVSFRAGSETHVAAPRLVIGADGRGSTVAKQIGVRMQQDPPHHFIGGLLVEGAESWPADAQVIGTEDETCFYIFPQGAGRVRLYTCWMPERVKSFRGEDAPRRFLEAFRFRSAPGSERFADAEIAGPLQFYRTEDHWTEHPMSNGVLLIGDAAGHNDPSLGQGLALALRDVRLVSETMLGSRAWSMAAFEPYRTDRSELLRRLRVSAHVFARVRMAFGEEGRNRRRSVFRRAAADPVAAGSLLGTLVGPDRFPAGSFSAEAVERLLAD